MKTGTFAAFVAPSGVMMLLFIAMPLLSVFWQSFHNTRVVYTEEAIERCTPGFPNPTCETERRSVPVLGPDGRPLTETSFVGLDNYRILLRTAEVGRLIEEGRATLASLLTVDFYRALRFTLTFTFVTLPFVIGLGLALAIALEATIRAIRGPRSSSSRSCPSSSRPSSAPSRSAGPSPATAS